ncbi:MAG: response regulator transcription factor [Chloroflexota bacterium]
MDKDRSTVRILVIEDDVDISDFIRQVLIAHQYQAITALSGREGLNVARAQRPDLVVLDVMMPGMNGLDVCRQIRADPALADTPVLFLTSKGDVEDKVAGLIVGADDYLAKPFDVTEFILRIRALLRRAKPKPGDPGSLPDELQVRDLRLDCKTYRASNATRSEVQLTRVQFALLHCLMSRPGEVFSPARLLQEVWAYPVGAGSPELVRAHVRILREKIEPDPSRPEYIVTVPGLGYVIQKRGTAPLTSLRRGPRQGDPRSRG